MDKTIPTPNTKLIQVGVNRDCKADDDRGKRMIQAVFLPQLRDGATTAIKM
jgi:hypothetical protein